jgi:hypothetical protein
MADTDMTAAAGTKRKEAAAAKVLAPSNGAAAAKRPVGAPPRRGGVALAAPAPGARARLLAARCTLLRGRARGSPASDAAGTRPARGVCIARVSR